MENQELWEDIEKFNDYKISDLGRVKSLKGNKEKILKGVLNKDGYLVVGLLNGKRKNKRIHRLVAIAFIPNPENKATVNHKKGIKTDNRASQLEWATVSENSLHSYRELGRVHSSTGKFGKDNPRSKPIIQLSRRGHIICEYSGSAEASRKTGIHQGHISEVCNGIGKSVGGFIWKFLNDK